MRRWLAAVVLALVVAGAWSAPRARPSLRVLAAASLADVLPAVAEQWRAAGGGAVTFSFDGTARLAAQLAAGAPADLFFSADEAWMDEVAGQGLVVAASRTDLLGNRLALIVPAGATDDGRGPLALAGDTVPAGRYARQALEREGAWDGAVGRVVRGDNVRTVLAWVARSEAAAGIVYATDARVEPRVAIARLFPDGSHDPIVYPAAVTAGAAAPEQAAAFLAFCRGEGRAVLEAAGFVVLPTAAP